MSKHVAASFQIVSTCCFLHPSSFFFSFFFFFETHEMRRNEKFRWMPTGLNIQTHTHTQTHTHAYRVVMQMEFRCKLSHLHTSLHRENAKRNKIVSMALQGTCLVWVEFLGQLTWTSPYPKRTANEHWSKLIGASRREPESGKNSLFFSCKKKELNMGQRG